MENIFHLFVQILKLHFIIMQNDQIGDTTGLGVGFFITNIFLVKFYI